jgi:hypothetical protein
MKDTNDTARQALPSLREAGQGLAALGRSSASLANTASRSWLPGARCAAACGAVHRPAQLALYDSPRLFCTQAGDHVPGVWPRAPQVTASKRQRVSLGCVVCHSFTFGLHQPPSGAFADCCQLAWGSAGSCRKPVSACGLCTPVPEHICAAYLARRETERRSLLLGYILYCMVGTIRHACATLAAAMRVTGATALLHAYAVGHLWCLAAHPVGGLCAACTLFWDSFLSVPFSPISFSCFWYLLRSPPFLLLLLGHVVASHASTARIKHYSQLICVLAIVNRP